MNPSTRNEPNDHDAAKLVSQPASSPATAKTAVRCRLCRETIVLETNFRPLATTCPHCGLKFVFDPQQDPLPVRGLRLRFSAVLEAEHRPGTMLHKRHDAHVHPTTLPVTPHRTNYLAWAGGLALSAAAVLVIFSGSLHKLFQHLP